MTVSQDCPGGSNAHIVSIGLNGRCEHCGSDGDDE